MSWCEDDSDQIGMRIYPSGSKRGNSIYVRLNKKDNSKRTVNVRSAEICLSDETDLDKDAPARKIRTEEQMDKDNYPVDDNWTMASWPDSDSDCSCFLEELRIDDANQSDTSWNDLGYHQKRTLDAVFNQAKNCAEQLEDSESSPKQLKDVLTTYRNKHYSRIHQIPVGNHVLEMEDGQQNITINGQPFQAILEPEANHNLISQQCQSQAGLTTNRNQGCPLNRSRRYPDFEYCADVPLRLREGPDLPGTFLVVDDSDTQGYDVVLGKPWMLGIEERFKDFHVEILEVDLEPKEEQERCSKRPYQDEDRYDKASKKAKTGPKEPDIPGLGGSVAKTL
jgi:hypothetical protein